MEIIQGIATGAPIWVWPLLFGLLALGFLSSRERNVPRLVFAGLPFLALITLNGARSLPLSELVWPCYILGFLAGAYVAYGLQSRWLLGREGQLVRVSGEWFTMAVLMIIFWSNFVAGIVQGIAPSAYETPAFLVPFAFITALASGSFLGRAIRALRYKGPIKLA